MVLSSSLVGFFINEKLRKPKISWYPESCSCLNSRLAYFSHVFHHLSFSDSLNSVLSGSAKQIVDMEGGVSQFISIVHIEKNLFTPLQI